MADSTWLRFAFVTIALAAGVYLVRSFWELAGFVFDVVIIIFLAWILASAMRRLVRQVQHYVPRPAWAARPIAYLVILLPIISVVGLVIPVTLAQAVSMAEDLPGYAQRISATMERGRALAQSLGFTELGGSGDEVFVREVGAAVSGWVRDNALGILQGATTIFLGLFFIIALSVYMVVEGDAIVNLFYRVVPAGFRSQVRGVLLQLDATFFSYLRGVSVIVGLYSVAITAVLTIAGLPFALPIGLASGFIQLVPVVGEVAALGIPILVAFMTGSLTTAIVVTITLAMWSIFMNNVVLPRVLGNAVQMPGLFVLLAVVLGLRFAGPWGAILGVPVAGFAYSVLIAWLERGTPVDVTLAPAASEEEAQETGTQQAEPLTSPSSES